MGCFHYYQSNHHKLETCGFNNWTSSWNAHINDFRLICLFWINSQEDSNLLKLYPYNSFPQMAAPAPEKFSVYHNFPLCVCLSHGIFQNVSLGDRHFLRAWYRVLSTALTSLGVWHQVEGKLIKFANDRSLSELQKNIFIWKKRKKKRNLTVWNDIWIKQSGIYLVF